MIQASLSQSSQRRELLGQLIRFGLVGFGSTLLYAAVYWPLATYVMWPVFAVVIAFAVAVTAGFFLHSRWSFKGHAAEPGGAKHVKFVLVQGTGLALNALITWVGTAFLHLHPWVPLVPAVFLAAIVTFVLNRFWVFS